MAHFNAKDDDARDLQIIGLLNQLGDRLIRSEKQRIAIQTTLKSYDALIAELESKTERSEQAFLKIQDKLSKGESIDKMLLKRQKKIEATFREQEERISRAVDMADRIEDALAKQMEFHKKLEQFTNDKARMVKQLARIEETVIETQEALNERAVVPLGNNPANDDETAKRGWWRNQTGIQAAGVSAIVILAILSGWAVSQMQMVGMPELTFTYAEQSPPEVPAQPTAIANKIDTAQDVDHLVSSVSQKIEPEEPSYDRPNHEYDTVSSDTVETETVAQDPLQMSDEQLLASLDADPDALAAQLNAIEPAAAPVPEDIAEPVENPPAAEVKNADADKPVNEKTAELTPVALTPTAAKEPVKEFTTEEFIGQQISNKPLAERVKRDPALPDVIRQVEDKAFEGVAEAQHDLAAIYTAGHGGVPVDYVKAATWFREAAANGIANARYNLGVLYHQGLGVSENLDTAIGWYRAAADLGHPEAQYNLGIAYIEGIGTQYDPARAADFFEKAAVGGILEAAYNLGLIYENGLLGTPRAEKALYWYKKAADQGSPEAQTALEQLAKALDIDLDQLNSLFPAEQAKSDPQKESSNNAEPVVTPKPEKHSNATPSDLKPRPPEDYKESAAADIEYIEEPAPRLADVVEEITDFSRADHAVTAQIQEQLVRLGLYPGPADGVASPMTEDAIRTYQSANSLKRDGRPSEALLIHMMTSEMDSTGEQEYGSRAE